MVGAAVLMGIAIIALPMMFDMERAAPVKVLETIPPRPAVSAVPQVPVTPPQPLQQDPVPVRDLYALPTPSGEAMVSPDQESAAPTPSTTTVPPVSEPVVKPAKPADKTAKAPAPAAVSKPTPPATNKLAANGMPQAWVVQVAAMSDQAKANAMIQQLRAKGFTAFPVPGKIGNANTVRVFIGPKLDKAQAMKVKQSVDQAMGLQTMVVPYSAR